MRRKKFQKKSQGHIKAIETNILRYTVTVTKLFSTVLKIKP
jgi:hypothetical protein